MKKHLIVLAALCAFAGSAAYAQSALDGAIASRQDLKGTARFMSMAGAFGALGGDITTMSYNPAGIGIYRSSEISLTVDLDFISGKAQFPGSPENTENQTKFLMNNGGYVGAMKLNSDFMPNFNWGVSYNRRANFNRRYSAVASQLNNSLSNYIAGVTNSAGATAESLTSTTGFDPYNPGSDIPAPWISILGYDSYFISDANDQPGGDPCWIGQFDSETSGSGVMAVEEKGGIDEYNISFGGNILNTLYWGMDFGIMDLDYSRHTVWGETLNNALVCFDEFGGYDADWNQYNMYQLQGSGFNYKLGLIYKPIQELRFGFAFHTPTWYNLTEYYYADTSYGYYRNGETIESGGAKTNDGWDGTNEFDFRTPWRFIASVAGVIGNSFIISADVDWTSQQYMHFSTPDDSGYFDPWDWGWGWTDDPWYSPAKSGMKKANEPSQYLSSDAYLYTNQDVKDYYKTTTTVRVGAEYRVIPQFSLRAGYSYTTSPVRDKAKNNELRIYTSDPQPSYEFEDDTNLVSFGMGYRYRSFYVDLAYTWRQMSSKWHAFSPGIGSPNYEPSYSGGAVAKVKSTENQVILTAGFRF